MKNMKSYLYEVNFQNGKTCLYWARSFKDVIIKCERDFHVRPSSVRKADPILSYQALMNRDLEANF